MWASDPLAIPDLVPPSHLTEGAAELQEGKGVTQGHVVNNRRRTWSPECELRTTSFVSYTCSPHEYSLCRVTTDLINLLSPFISTMGSQPQNTKKFPTISPGCCIGSWSKTDVISCHTNRVEDLDCGKLWLGFFLGCSGHTWGISSLFETPHFKNTKTEKTQHALKDKNSAMRGLKTTL